MRARVRPIQCLDVLTNFQTPEGPYSPLNYDRRFHGVIPLRVALASSYNVPAVRVLDEIGVEAFLEMAHRFGLETLGRAPAHGLALPLGGGEVTLLELTNAYAALAAGGVLAKPVAVTRVRDTAGRVLYESPHAGRSPSAACGGEAACTTPAARTLAPEHAYLLADILSDPAARQPGFGYAPALELPFHVAVKTGTSTGFRDNWTAGFTGNRAVGVWLGNANGRPMDNISGVDGAAPIWRDVMLAASRAAGAPWPARPAEVVERAVCAPTGMLPGPHCPSLVRELFVRGTEPAQTERIYGQDDRGLRVRYLSEEATPWALDAGVAVVPASDDIPRVLFILQPANGTTLYRSPELPDQETILRAAAPIETESVEFLVDGLSVATAVGRDPRAIWALQPGQHHLEVVAHLPGGGRLQTGSRFEVR